MTKPPPTFTPHAPLQTYVMDAELFKPQWAGLLTPFCPPLPREGQVILASYFGDVFVEDVNGAVWWVNGMEERVDRIAINREQLLERMNNEHVVMLKTQLMEELIKAGKLLPVGMVYGLKTPRSAGGQYATSNVGTAPVADAFAYMGQLFRTRAAAAPPPKASEAAPAKASAQAKDQDKKKSPFWGKK